MKTNYYEVKECITTIEDMIKGLLEVPKDYFFHPLGQQCAMAIDHYHKCIYLDTPDWIDEYEYELVEEMKLDKNDTAKIDVSKLSPFTFFYVWEEIDDNNGFYTYFSDEETAKSYYRDVDANKTYGTASFADGILQPVKTINSTL